MLIGGYHQFFGISAEKFGDDPPAGITKTSGIGFTEFQIEQKSFQVCLFNFQICFLEGLWDILINK